MKFIGLLLSIFLFSSAVLGNVPPKFLSFSANTNFMTPTTELRISAIVTDPDGVDDLIGGVLVDLESNSELTYGAFITSAAEGAYQITLDWKQINEVRKIETAPGGSPRTFTARFFDQIGNQSEKSLTIMLGCDGGSSFAVCGGSCTNVMTSPTHCGSCDQRVPNNTSCIDGHVGCSDSLSLCEDRCVSLDSEFDNCGECGHSCSEFSGRLNSSNSWCETGRCYAKAARHYGSPTSCDRFCAQEHSSCIGSTYKNILDADEDGEWSHFVQNNSTSMHSKTIYKAKSPNYAKYAIADDDSGLLVLADNKYNWLSCGIAPKSKLSVKSEEGWTSKWQIKYMTCVCAE